MENKIYLGSICVSEPSLVEVPDVLIDMVANQLRQYVMEDGLKDNELEVLTSYAEAICCVFTDVRDNVVLAGKDYVQWVHDSSPVLIQHAKKYKAVYKGLSYMRSDVVGAKSWAVLTIVELAVVKKKESGTEMDLEYIVRFGENVIGEMFAAISAEKA
jgi:hypothetical protein